MFSIAGQSVARKIRVSVVKVKVTHRGQMSNNKIKHSFVSIKIWKQSDPSEELITTKLHEPGHLVRGLAHLKRCNVKNLPWV
jgi:hypothetical protein